MLHIVTALCYASIMSLMSLMSLLSQEEPHVAPVSERLSSTLGDLHVITPVFARTPLTRSPEDQRKLAAASDSFSIGVISNSQPVFLLAPSTRHARVLNSNEA